MLKVVLDTNVFVSSLLVRAGGPARLLDAWRERKYLLVTSPSILAEVRSTLNYPRIRRKYVIHDEDLDQLIDLLEHEALVVPGQANVSGAVPDDPSDEAILACAVDAEADLIVSGDRHLLGLGEYQGIAILTVGEFMRRVEEEE